MAAAQHKLSRREVLAGACAGAAIPLPRHSDLVSGSNSPPALPPQDWTPDRVRGDERAKRWQRALARYERAEAEIEALRHSEDENLYDRAADRQLATLGGLLKAPAPDLASAAWKLELIVRHVAWELRYGDDAFSVLLADLRRFAAQI